jgi:hypothetical protein
MSFTLPLYRPLCCLSHRAGGTLPLSHQRALSALKLQPAGRARSNVIEYDLLGIGYDLRDGF